MDIYKLNKKKLNILDSQNFESEKEIQLVVEKNTEEIFNLKFVKSEFSIKNYRIDTLCFDEENKSFVIIEYKKGSSYSVVDQGFSYLSKMLNNKSDFVLEYNELNDSNLKRNEIDWSQSRIIFISTHFNSYQRDSANFKDMPFELWEIKKLSDDLVGLDNITSTSKESYKSVAPKGSDKNVLKEVSVYDEDGLIEKSSEKIKELYFELKEKVSSWTDLKIKFQKNYIGLAKGNRNKVYLNLQKNRIKIHLLKRIDFNGNVKSKKILFNLDDPKKIHTLYESKHKEQYEILLENKNDLDYVVSLMKQKYDT